MDIPVLDLSDFTSSVKEKEGFARDLGQAFEAIGFAAIKHHYISDPLVSTLYGQVRHFFALPLEKKLQYEVAGIAGQRGYAALSVNMLKALRLLI